MTLSLTTTTIASGRRSLRCLVAGHREWDTSRLSSVVPDRVCLRCGRQARAVNDELDAYLGGEDGD